jgi:hypothetical protein
LRGRARAVGTRHRLTIGACAPENGSHDWARAEKELQIASFSSLLTSYRSATEVLTGDADSGTVNRN